MQYGLAGSIPRRADGPDEVQKASAGLPLALSHSAKPVFLFYWVFD